MKLFDGVIDKIADRLHTKSVGGWANLWASAREYLMLQGKTVDRPYEKVASVFKAVKAIADNVPQAEVEFRRWSDDEVIYPKDLIRLFRRPSMTKSYSDFLQMASGMYALYGEAFIEKQVSLGQIAGTTKVPAGLIVLDPRYVEAGINKETGQIVNWRYLDRVIALDNMIPITDFNPYDFNRGMSPTKPLKNEIEVDYVSMLYNKKFFDNDASGGVVLTTEKSLTDAQRKRLIDDWEKKHRGSDKAHRPDLLEGGLKVENMARTHKDMDFIEQKKYVREEILGTYRSPKALFNITESLNYATFTGQMKIFWIYTLNPILRKFEDALNAHLIVPYDSEIYLAFNTKNVPAFQEDFRDKVETGAKMFAMGIPLNSINEKLDLGFDKFAWGDDWWVSFGMIPAKDAGNDPAGGQGAGAKAHDGDELKAIDGIIKSPAPYKTTAKKMALWKSFLKRQAPIEKGLESKLRRFFFDQRKRALDGLKDTQATEHILDWTAEKERLVKIVTPFIDQAVKDGVAQAKEILTNAKSIEDQALAFRMQGYIKLCADRITRINDTVKNQIAKTMNAGIAEGESINMLADRVREVYTMAGNRAKLIARTESAGALNGGSEIYYTEVGVNKKEWITAHDEVVRESHRDCEAQGAILMAQKFSNGLAYPADMTTDDASETVNCRCTIAPVIE